jgi:hypothetical protein
MVLKLEVRWTGDDGTQTLTDVISVNIMKNDELRNNSMDIVLRNDSSSTRPYVVGGIIKFNTEQPIDLFIRYDNDGSGLDDYNTNYLIFSGRVVEFTCGTEEKQTNLTLKCADSSYIALNRIWIGVEADTPPNLIQKIIRFINQNIADPNKQIICITEKDVTAIATDGTVTSAAHGLNNDEPVVLYDTNSTPSADGRWIVSDTSANTFRLKDKASLSYPTFSVAGTAGTIGGVQSLDSDGSAYASVAISKVAKPAYEIIQELSQPEMTGEVDKVPNRFHVDKWNSIRWFYPDDTVRHVITEGITSAQSATYYHPVLKQTQSYTDTRGHEVVNVKMTFAVYDIVNFIIFKAGQNLEDEQITYFAYQDGSGSPVSKDSYRSWEDIARELKRREAAIGNLTFSKNDEYTIANSSGTTSWGVVYATDDEYNDAFILEARRLALARAQAEFDKTGNPRWQGDIELKGEHSFDVNDTLVFTSARHGIRNIFMRITSVKHNISKGGWFTTITVKEEVPKSLLS